MAKILQLRRGTTAQNNNFTGLEGELTFDTETKKLRVHDGKTLGGFILSPESAETGGDFDINTVPDSFWEALFEKFSKPCEPSSSFKTTESRAVPIDNNPYLEYIFDIYTPALYVRPVLVCQGAEAGYSANDEVNAFGVGEKIANYPNTSIDEDGLHVFFFMGREQFWVRHKTTGVPTNVTNANWKIKFIVWY